MLLCTALWVSLAVKAHNGLMMMMMMIMDLLAINPVSTV